MEEQDRLFALENKKKALEKEIKLELRKQKRKDLKSIKEIITKHNLKEADLLKLL
jgi:hypothetical protein